MIPYASLPGLLTDVEPGRPLWQSADRRVFTAEQIRTQLLLYQPLRESLAGKIVAIRASRSMDCALFMTLVDGVARAIVLLPASLSAEVARGIIEQTESQFLLTDGPTGCADLGLPAASPRPFDATDSVPSRQEIRMGADTRWVIPTSGTTGAPKLVGHTLSTLTRTVRLATAVGAQHRWGSLYNLMGFAGLQVFFQSWFGGSCLLMTDDSMDLRQRVAYLAREGCTALSATPTMWRRILMAPEAAQLPLRQITLGGEIVDQQILDALRRAFPNARLTHIYASTEAGVGFAVTDGREGFPSSLLDCPPAGMAIRVSPDRHLMIRAERDNQQYLKPTVHLRDGEGFIDTGDVVSCEADRYVFEGRADGRITIGGNKVYPEEIERVLRSFPGVADALVDSIRSSIVGELVQATVACDSTILDKAQFKRSLMEHCREHLALYKVPAIIRFVDAVRLNANGKMLRTAEMKREDVE